MGDANRGYPTQWRNWNIEICLSFTIAIAFSLWGTFGAHKLVLDPRIGTLHDLYTRVPLASRCITTVDQLVFFRCSCSGCAHQALVDTCTSGCLTDVPWNGSDASDGTSWSPVSVMGALHRLFAQGIVDDASINQTSTSMVLTIPWLHAVLTNELQGNCPYGERRFPPPIGCSIIRPWPNALNLDAQIPEPTVALSV